VNVPTVGQTNVVQPGIVAADIPAAIAIAKANIIITALAVQQTAP
jgi:hypothetical protein